MNGKTRPITACFFCVLILLPALVYCVVAPFAAGDEAASETPQGATAEGRGQIVGPDEVAAAIERAVAYIKSHQEEDGTWPYEKIEHKQGLAALCVFALSQAGAPKDDAACTKGMEYVVSQPFTMTYEAACAALAITSFDPGKYVRALAQARDALVAGQDDSGMWTYIVAQANKRGGDGSNTQFAILGLDAAASVGLSVPDQVVQRSFDHYARTQNGDGGWGYTPGGTSYGAMTAAGVAALHMLGARLYTEGEVCGQYRQEPHLAAGFTWLERNYSVRTHPGIGGEQRRLWYYLYALERVGVLTGEKYIGGHDWYLEGARFLVDTQNRDGSWSSGTNQLADTAFALLFLAKGNVPVLINKLNYGGDWNADPHDTENLTRYISAKFGQAVGWQAVLPRDSMETLLSAPILYVTGHEFPRFTQSETARLREFFDNGGFMLADACCSSKKFDAGFRSFAATVFPDVTLAPLDRSHPVYRSLLNLSSSAATLEGVDAGCRTNIIYTPTDLSCTWEKGDIGNSEAAFQLGANIAAYVTGKERLVPKLEQYKAIVSEKTATAPPGAFAFAQVIYATGRWNPHPASGPKLVEFLREKAGLTVASNPVTLLLTDKNLANYPFIYMTGCKRFQLAPEDKTALGEYLKRGGFLFADATAGKAEFDESFRALMSEVFPGSPLEPIPADSPVYRIAFDTSRVTYSPAVRELNPNLTTLTLYGAKVDGRIAVVYSPYDIGCALTRFPAYGIRGLVTEDAYKVAANVVLFALSH